ncbi:MAG: hypothetical protein E6I22_03420 [Chloroflexi bacterium]|nr:MAG: hypothetical protein E6I22_03420 [Chloroflexota bacterium]TMG40916.1 MAG: hypothetical protein E6H92_01570 [Chloroflexota bacterium]
MDHSGLTGEAFYYQENSMALARANMQQVTPHTWSFHGPQVPMAPMKAHCRACKQSVPILRPSSLDLNTGNYVVRGECGVCGAEVVLIVS